MRVSIGDFSRGKAITLDIESGLPQLLTGHFYEFSPTSSKLYVCIGMTHGLKTDRYSKCGSCYHSLIWKTTITVL